MGHADTHRRMHDAFNARRYDEIEAAAAPGYMYEDLPRHTTIKSPEEFTDYLKEWVAGFSDGMVSTPQYLEGPDFSVAMYHGRGTHDGMFAGIPATGRSADLPFCEVLHYASDGRVLSGEVYYDQLSMMGQLGIGGPPEEGTHDSLEPVVRRAFEAFDRLDLEAVMALTTADAQGVDEISRRWLRDADQIGSYMSELKDAITDVHSELSDFRESISGDLGIVTCWLEQDYTLDGQRQHISAPTTIALRRSGADWKVCLIHSVALPDES